MSKPRVEQNAWAVTADMPTDYVATNGYEYILKSKYDAVVQERDELAAQLANVTKDYLKNDPLLDYKAHAEGRIERLERALNLAKEQIDSNDESYPKIERLERGE